MDEFQKTSFGGVTSIFDAALLMLVFVQLKKRLQSAAEGERENDTRKRKRDEKGQISKLEPGRTNYSESSRKRKRIEKGEISNLEPGRTNYSESSRLGPHGPHLSRQQSKLKGPKHTIFLSHSGAQKHFTGFLFNALKDAHYAPFFDADDEILRKGEKWYTTLIEAARQCRVAVLVLSREFFTRSKWPMMELNEFAKIQKRDDSGVSLGPKLKVLPLFLDITFEEFEKNKNEKLWFKDWTKWKESDNRSIDLEEWHQALSIIKKSKALSYQHEGHHNFIRKVVDAILKLVEPDVKYDVPDNQSIGIVCSPILQKLKEISPSTKYKVKVMGLYGMGGIGKTTISRAVCNEMFRDFGGKVCHIELGHMESLEVQKRILKELTHANPTTLIEHHGKLHDLLEKRIREHKVFLVIDNVQSYKVEEVIKYLQIKYHDESMILVTSRSLDILVQLSIDESDCMEMPQMDYGIASDVFSYYLGHKKAIIENEDILKEYMEKCIFKKGSGDSKKWYHPLALKVLGSQLQRISEEFKQRKLLEEFMKGQSLNILRGSELPIFSILRLGYDALCLEDQYIFLDLALFWTPQWKNQRFELKYMWGWMCIMYRKSKEALDESIHALQRNGLINTYHHLNGLKWVYIHDLYIAFAEAEAQIGPFKKRRYLIDKNGVDVPFELLKNPPGSCWPILERLIITSNETESFKKAKLKWCSNLEALYLYKCDKLRSIDIGWLENLRSIEVVACPKLELSNDEVERLRNLSFVQISHSDGAFLPQLFQSSTNLQILIVDHCSNLTSLEGITKASSLQIIDISDCGNLKELPRDMRNLMQLEDLIIRKCDSLVNLGDIQALKALKNVDVSFCTCLKVLPKGFSGLKHLEELDISYCSNLLSLDGIQDLGALKKLNASKCASLKELPKDLRGLQHLEEFDISWSLELLNLDGIQGLGALKKLNVSRCSSLKKFPKGSSGLKHLKELDLSWCSELLTLDGIQGLGALKKLNVSRCSSLKELPKDLSGLKHLEELDLSWCLELLTLDGIQGLEALEKLNASTCSSLKELPKDLSGLKHLEELDLSWCSEVLTLDGIQGLGALEKLNAIWCSSLKKLPKDLSGLNHLKELDLSRCSELLTLDGIQGLGALKKLNASRCSSLKELPIDSSGLKHLKELDLSRCSELLTLDGIQGLGALKKLNASRCSSLKELPKDLSGLKHVEELDLSWCSESLNLDGIRGLGALKKLNASRCSSLKELPKDLSGLKHLVELDLSWCLELLTLDGIQGLGALKKLNASGCSSLKELPKDLSELKHLEELDLSWCLESLTLDGIQGLGTLRKLNVSRCSSLKELPKDLSGLKHLEELDLSWCSELLTLDGIQGLEALKKLNATWCSSLKELPKDLSGLKHLEKLDLSWCSELLTLDGIKELKALTSLGLSECTSLKTLPEGIKELKALKSLDLSWCKSLKELPEGIRELTTLTHLDLEFCIVLEALPEGIKEIKALRTLNFKGCSSLKKLSKGIMGLKAMASLDLSQITSLKKVLESIKEVKSSEWKMSFELQSTDLPSRRLLGKGLSGIGYETMWNGARYARKDFVGVPKETFLKEAPHLVGFVDHNNIVKAYGWTTDKRSCSLVLEYMDDDLLSLLQKRENSNHVLSKQSSTSPSTSPFDLSEALDMISQIAYGIEYLHRRGIAHGDLKSKNIFVSWMNGKNQHSKVVKVTDYGLVETKRKSRFIVSRQVRKLDMVRWKAPECWAVQFTRQLHTWNDEDGTSSDSESDSSPSSAYDVSFTAPVANVFDKFAADVYSFAMVCLELLTGNTPYPRMNWKELGCKILDGLRPNLPDACHPLLRDLLVSCWGDPSQRPSFAIICSDLKVIRQSLTTVVANPEPDDFYARSSLAHTSLRDMSFELQSRDLPSRRLLGKGLAGIGYETMWKGARYARKDFVGVRKETFLKEVPLLVGLGDHKNVLKTHGWTLDKRSCSLVLEYMDDDLPSFLLKRTNCTNVLNKPASTSTPPPPFDLSEALDLMFQISTGMAYLHAEKLPHGDLKSKNILVSRVEGGELNSNIVKVADFGLVRTKRKSKFIVSRQVRKLDMVRWKAPECWGSQVLRQPNMSNSEDGTSSESESESSPSSASRVSFAPFETNAADRFAADVYSFAVICSELLTGNTPYPHMNWKLLGHEILNGLRPDLPDACHPVLRDLLTSCWGDPAQRPSFATICSELSQIQQSISTENVRRQRGGSY